MSNLALTSPQSDLDVAPLLLPATVLRNDAQALSAAHELAQAARAGRPARPAAQTALGAARTVHPQRLGQYFHSP